MINLKILEKVRPERRHSAQFGSLERTKPSYAETRQEFKNRILNDMQYAQFKRKTLLEAQDAYSQWLESFNAHYNIITQASSRIEEVWI